MNLQQKFLMIWKGEKKISDIWHYLVGNYRYKLYYSKKFSWLIRVHIHEQIDQRIKWMNKECYDSGSCVMCGCETLQLQMCNKSCDKPCYPSMMNKREWRDFKNYSAFTDKNGVWLLGYHKEDKLLHFKQTTYGFVQDN